MLDIIADYLPENIMNEINKLNSQLKNKIEEIRMRANNRVVLTASADKFFLGNPKFIIASKQDITQTLTSLAEHSLYSKTESIINGYFSVKGGVRVGVCGNCLYENNRLTNMNHFTSLNIRIPRAIQNIYKPVYKYINKNGYIQSTLIISSPGQGKTTLLRDIARAVANGEDFRVQSCCIIDERSEIAGTFGDNRLFDVGCMSDVLNCVKKPDGIRMAIRTMAPDVIVTDEIGDISDLRALCEARNSGVVIIASAHADNIHQLQKRVFFQKIIDEKIFSKIILLGCSQGRGTVEAIYNDDLIDIYRKDKRTNYEDNIMHSHINLYVSNRN